MEETRTFTITLQLNTITGVILIGGYLIHSIVQRLNNKYNNIK